MRWYGCILMVGGLGGGSWGLGQRVGPSATEILPKIYDYSERYTVTLPSLSCDELIVSQVVRKGVVKKEVKIASTLREVRVGAGPRGFVEKHEFRTVDGAPSRANAKIPYFVQGGFANAIGFTDRSKVGCYAYQVFAAGEASLRLEMTGRPDGATCKDVPEGYRKTVVVDAETGRVEHVERTISAQAARRMKETYFASVDYGLQPVGDGTLWLPVRMTAHDENDEGRMVVTYTNYHRYAGHATISDEPVKEVPE